VAKPAPAVVVKPLVKPAVRQSLGRTNKIKKD
jgi:hypothetical protein